MKTKNVFFYFSIAIGLGLCGILFCVRLSDLLAWKTYFANLRTSIQQCQMEVVPWRGSLETAVSEARPSVAITLPLRGNEDAPKVSEDFVQVIRCAVDLSGTIDKSAVWISLARIYGESAIYWNDQLILKSPSGHRVEFPAPPSAWHSEQNSLTIASRGDSVGAVGPWTLTPPYVAKSVGEDSNIRRFIMAIYVEQPAFSLGLCLAFLIFLLLIWLQRIRFWDIVWTAFFLAAVSLQNIAVYGLNFFSQAQNASSRLQGLALCLQTISLFSFIVCFARQRKLERILPKFIPIVCIGTILIFVLVPESAFFSWRMKVQLPLLIAAICIALAPLLVFIVSRKDTHMLMRKRLAMVTKLSIALSIIYIFTLKCDEKYDLNLVPLTQIGVMLTINLTLLKDLARRHQEFFEIKSTQMLQRTQSEFVEAARHRISFVQHDIMKPIMALERILCDSKVISDDGRREISYIKSLVAKFQPESDRKVCQPIDLKDVCEKSFLISKTRFPDRDCHISYEFDSRSKVQIDESDLQRVLVNLIDNAFEATAKDFSITISVCAIANATKITVSNTGSSIPRGDRERIFQGGQSTKSRSTGNQGIGLAFCKDVIEQVYRGEITAGSDDNSSWFNITLPNSFPGGLDPKRTIALIDDDDSILMMWKWHFANSREVFVFSTCKEFEAWWSIRTTFERSDILVVTDLILGSDSAGGLSVAKFVKRDSPSTTVLLSSSFKVDSARSRGLIDGQIDKDPSAVSSYLTNS